jgi:hypothetical protein
MRASLCLPPDEFCLAMHYGRLDWIPLLALAPVMLATRTCARSGPSRATTRLATLSSWVPPWGVGTATERPDLFGLDGRLAGSLPHLCSDPALFFVAALSALHSPCCTGGPSSRVGDPGDRRALQCKAVADTAGDTGRHAKPLGGRTSKCAVTVAPRQTPAVSPLIS